MNLLANGKILDWPKLKALAGDNIDVIEKKLTLIIYFGKGRKHCGERRKCWLPAFSPLPTMFSKGFFSRVIISHDCVRKGYICYKL